ncbi:MAG: T9SS C-terminal target domain-containing protein [Calditrichaeota bacterium]|nr:MAG: T9SS C-terminal target domain-containing protein [Calditrichota bacterium]
MKKLFFLMFLSSSIFNSSGAQDNVVKSGALKLSGMPESHVVLQNYYRYTSNPETLAEADTLRILAIRVEFEPDTLSATTGDGSFDLSSPAEPTVDPSPHDRTYFEDQLQALANYYKTVSNNKQILTWDVYPSNTNDAFKVSNDILYYAPNDGSPLVDTRLAELFRDGFLQADQNESIDFSRYDSFILFHAGVGNDINFDFDPTPNDITSVFLRFEDLKKEFGPEDATYQGIGVNNGAYFIRNGLILPETESQEGFEIGLLGTMTIMMGFQLGLPSLFDPETGGTGIGRWGLMDQGSGNAVGLLPAEPNAWEKVFMGWEKPIVIEQGTNFQVGAARADFPNRIYKIPITNDEYFLVENRQQDVNRDSIAIGFDSNGNRVEFNLNGQLVSNEVIGVITSVDEYDFGLPGSGILIWHINDAVIRDKIAENRINADRNNRGVDLEEADVAQDFGYFYDFLHPGSGTENGWWADAWFDSNTVNLEANDNDKIQFGPNTRPSSRSNSMANSGIVIDDISAIQPIMSFSLSRDLHVTGFPAFSGTAIFPPVVGEFDPLYIGEETLVFTNENQVLAWHGDGSPMLNTTKQVIVESPGNEQRVYEIPEALVLNDRPFSYPVVADLNADGRDEFIFCSSNGALKAYQTQDLNGDNQFDVLWDLNLGFKTSSALTFVNGNIHFATDKLITIDGAGNVVSSLTLQDEVVDLAHANTSFYLLSDEMLHDANSFVFSFSGPGRSVASGPFGLAVNTDSELFFLNENDEISVQLDEKFAESRIAIGDVDGDGRHDVVLTTGNYITAFNNTGAVIENFPLKIGSFPASSKKLLLESIGLIYDAEPLLLNIDNDAAQEIFIVGAEDDLWGIDNGAIIDGFPVAFAGGVIQSPTAGDIDNDGELEILAVSSDGFLHAFDISGVAKDGDHAWLNYGGNRHHTRSNTIQRTPQNIDGDLLPEKYAYNYPNPTEGSLTTIRYRLAEDATISIKIFDLAGDLVDEFPGTGNGDVDNEVQWNVSGIQNGVYMARIEAKSSSKNGVAIFKISVIK